MITFDTDLRGAVSHIQWRISAPKPPPDASASDRQLFNAGRSIAHPQERAISHAISFVHSGNVARGPLATRNLVGVAGDFKSGKTSAIARLMAGACESTWAEEGTEVVVGGVRSEIRPVFYATASASGEADLMRSILRSLGVPAGPARESASSMLARAAMQCERSRTRFGFIDDANMLASSARGEFLTQFAKKMLNDLPVTLVFIGKGLRESAVFSAASRARVDADAADQINRRTHFLDVTPLQPTLEGAASLRRLVGETCSRVDLRLPPELTGRDLAWLHGVTEGRVGEVLEVLTTAATIAVGASESLNGDVIRLAHARLRGDRK